jgi:hypothetical protein
MVVFTIVMSGTVSGVRMRSKVSGDVHILEN